MSYFSIEQIQEIHNKLLEFGQKDSQLTLVEAIDGSEYVPILSENGNRLIKVGLLGGGGGSILIDKPLVSPTLTGHWVVNGILRNDKNIEVPIGSDVLWTGNYKWNIKEDYKAPSLVGDDSDFINYDLPTEGKNSNTLSINNIEKDREIVASIKAPINGVVINDLGNLINTKGFLQTQDSYKIEFKPSIFYINHKELFEVTGININNNFSLVLINSDNLLLKSITTTPQEYLSILIPFENINDISILQNNGIDIKEAFNIKQVTILFNNKNLSYYILTTINKGAFTNKNINIKFNK